MLMIPLMALPGRDGNCSGTGTGEFRPDTGALLAPRAISFSERKLAYEKTGDKMCYCSSTVLDKV